MATRTRHAEEQRRYRDRLRERAKTAADGTRTSRGAPETRAVVQSLATAVRKLAAAAKKSPDAPAAAVYQKLMEVAHKSLIRQGFDAGESSARLIHYTLSDKAKARRQRAATEERYWSGGKGPTGVEA